MNRIELMTTLDLLRDEVPSVIDVIAPFGFETLPGWDLKRVKPKRLYIYAQVPLYDRELAAKGIADWLISNSPRLTGVLQSEPLSFVSLDNRSLVIAAGPSGGLGCFVYFVDPMFTSLLECYGSYVAMLPVAIAEGRLNEMRQFVGSPSSRRFVFQSTRMFAGSHSAAISSEQSSALALAAQRNGSHDSPTATRTIKAADADDNAVLNSIVLPVARGLREELREGPRLRSAWTDIHSGYRTDFSVSAERVSEVRSWVMKAYTQGSGSRVA